MRTIIFVIFICSCLTAHAQKNWRQHVDSLKQELPKQREDTAKAKILQKISFLYLENHKPKEVLRYGNQVLLLSEKLNYKKGVAAAHTEIGLAYQRERHYKKALAHAHAALKVNLEMGIQNNIGGSLCNIGIVYMAKKITARH